MRILLVSPMLPEIGGISVSSERLMKRLKSDGHDVRVCSMSFTNARLNNRWLKLLRFLLIPFWILIQPKYDIIHFHVTGTFRRRYIAAYKWAFHGAKLIFSIHGDVSHFLNKSLKQTLQKSDLIICVQPGDAARLKQRFDVRAVDIPAFIMPASMDDADIPGAVMDFVNQANDTPLMLATGGIVLEKHFHDLYGLQDTIDLYQHLKRQGCGVRLLLVVIGSNFTSDQQHFLNGIKAQVDSDPDVMLTDGIAMPLVPLFKHAKLFLRPTKTDGDAVSVREALAMRCNVLASDAAVRPSGVMTYHTPEQMRAIAKRILQGELSSDFQGNDYYAKIVQAYEKLMQ